MVRRTCKHCPIPRCGSKFLVRLANHLTQIHELSEMERKYWLQFAKLQNTNMIYLVQLYTGQQSAKVFELPADKLRDKAVRLHYVRGSESNTPKAHQLGENRKKPGPERKTSVEEEFFMTLVRHRQGLSEEDLAFRLKVCQSTVSRIVTTWISFLSKELSRLIHWPTREENKLYYPECFKSYPNVKAIIDCTEVYIQRPSLAEAQALTYSNYKSTNTWKTLVRQSC